MFRWDNKLRDLELEMCGTSEGCSRVAGCDRGRDVGMVKGDSRYVGEDVLLLQAF